MLSNKTKMYRPPGIGGGGIKMVLYREAPPRGPNPYTNPPSPPPPPPRFPDWGLMTRQIAHKQNVVSKYDVYNRKLKSTTRALNKHNTRLFDYKTGLFLSQNYIRYIAETKLCFHSRSQYSSPFSVCTPAHHPLHTQNRRGSRTTSDNTLTKM